MASANKQQKRATRAKAKAKQNRSQRAAAPVELDPNDDRIDFDSVDLTDAGRAIATPRSAPLTTQELHNVIFARLPSPQARVLRPLIDHYPDPVNREDLADRAGYSVHSSSFTNALGALRTMGLIDYPSSTEAVALPVLFLE